MKEGKEETEFVSPGEVLGKISDLKAGRGAYVANNTVYASLSGFRRIIPPPTASSDLRSTVEVTGHKAHGAVPAPGSIVIARVTKVMSRMASADIMCVGPNSVKEKFTGIIRQQDVRATEIDEVDMHLSFRPGDIVKALVFSPKAFSWRCKGLSSINCKKRTRRRLCRKYSRCSDGSRKLDRNAVSINSPNSAKKSCQSWEDDA